MNKKQENMMVLTYYRINKKIFEKCAYPKCKRMVKFLVRDGRKDFFLPLCDFHQFKYETFDDPHLEERYRYYKRIERRKENEKRPKKTH